MLIDLGGEMETPVFHTAARFATLAVFAAMEIPEYSFASTYLRGATRARQALAEISRPRPPSTRPRKRLGFTRHSRYSKGQSRTR